jgi:hypothetical protein
MALDKTIHFLISTHQMRGGWNLDVWFSANQAPCHVWKYHGRAGDKVRDFFGNYYFLGKPPDQQKGSSEAEEYVHYPTS